MIALCLFCCRARQLTLVCTEPDGAQWWFCRRCTADFLAAFAGIRARARRSS